MAAGKDVSFEAVIERIHPDDRETVEREVRHALANRSDYAGEFRAVLPDGTLRWIASRGRGYPDANGTPIRMVGAAIDITERKRGEEALRLSEARLAHAGRVTLLGQLASALAHELSQPLGAILRNAEAAEIMLREPSPDLEELRAIVADILRDDHRAGDVIDRLRSLLKRGSLSPLPVDLGEVVGEVLSLLRGDAAARHVRVESSIAPNLPLVLGDRIHLQQVLINLLVNAMDALDGVAQDERLVRVTIRRRVLPPSKSRWRTRATESRRNISHACSNRSSPPRAQGWASALPSRKPSLKPTRENSGPRTIRQGARVFTSRFPWFPALPFHRASHE